MAILVILVVILIGFALLRSGPKEAVRRPLEDADLTIVASGGQWEVVGESNYQSALSDMSGGLEDDGPVRNEHIAHLEREPNNPHDANAVRVSIQGRTVGYLGKSDAKKIQSFLQDLEERGHPACCRCRLYGGFMKKGERASLGVRLSMGDPPKLRKEFKKAVNL